MELDKLIKELKVELAWIEKLKKGGSLPDVIIDYILGVGGSFIPVNPLYSVAGRISLGMVLKDVNRKSKEEYDFLYNKIFIKKIGLTRITEILIDLNRMGLSESTPNLQQRLMEYILQGKYPINMYKRWMKDSRETLEYLGPMREYLGYQDPTLNSRLETLKDIKKDIDLWTGNLSFVAAQVISQQNKKKGKNAGASPDNTEGAGSGFSGFASFFPEDIYASPLPFDSDILSFVDNMLHSFNPLSDEGFLSASPDGLLSSSIPDYYNQFTLGDVPRIPIQYNISISGMDQVESASEMVSQTTEAMNFNDQTLSDYALKLSEQFDTLNEEERTIYSVNAGLSSLNGTYLGGLSYQITTIADESRPFSETLTDISKIGFEIGGAFMNVNEEIGKAIGSAGGLAGGISKIFSALNTDPLAGMNTSRMTPEQIEAARKQGEKQNGLALMAGIQGGFAGLQGLFGGEAGSDMSELLGGMGGVGAGVAGILTDNPLEGIQSIISGLPSFIDGLTESTQEGYVKQLSKQGFNDTYSEDLLDKMSAVSDKMGDKSFGITAYIEDFFKETNIDNAEEFSRLSDYLNESIGAYVAQGHTMDEAYDKFGDELEQLTAAQEKYGFETTASLDTMIEIQKTQTKAGRIEGLQGALGGFDKIISGIEKQMKLSPDFKLSEASISGIAGSLTNTYQELLNQGMGAGEAVDAVKPLLTEYADMAEKQGWDLSKVPGFSQLSSYFDSLDKASGALDMISGSADVVKALSGSGMMDQATLESQGSLGLDVMRQLEASGLNDTQVLQQMGGWLQAMQQASEKWGLSLSPDIEALIVKAEEKGVLPEEVKPIDEVISGGIETGFTRAIDVIDKYFGNLAEYGEGGMVPGSSGQKKLIWAHAGEAVGYPEELSKLAADPELAQGLSGMGGMLAAMMQNMGAAFASISGGTESIVASLQNLADGRMIDIEELQMKAMINAPIDNYSIAMDRVTRQSNAELAAKVEAARQAQAESNKLHIEQTIENNMKIAVNGRDFVNAIKQDLYDQLKEDSRRGMITIHDSAIRKY